MAGKDQPFGRFVFFQTRPKPIQSMDICTNRETKPFFYRLNIPSKRIAIMNTAILFLLFRFKNLSNHLPGILHAVQNVRNSFRCGVIKRILPFFTWIVADDRSSAVGLAFHAPFQIVHLIRHRLREAGYFIVVGSLVLLNTAMIVVFFTDFFPIYQFKPMI